ncbi:hypothetical protein Dda_0464 [Drechslerella dactyloides]|uniref:DUF1763-domain-containing protein n=1 Tax=Drechslerella dactyloides TaxID=74499 RepID=A0AAD6J6E2_DREDA|nr:hypothetical protein Dda_0464 [Drechslerella dactyloides]
MAALPPSRLDIIRAYRHLLRAGLRAVQYSSPARYAIRSKLRHAFRPEAPQNFNVYASPASQLPSVFPKTFSQTRIDNTIRFLDTAAMRLGMEHNIVKNLCHVEYRRHAHRSPRAAKNLKPEEWVPLNVVFDEYDDTLRMLNETMQLELR